MNKIKRERIEIIRGTIVIAATSLVLYFLIGLIVMGMLHIISADLTSSLSQNIIFSVIFTFICFIISTIATIFLFFKNRDLEDEVGRDILKYTTIVLSILALIVAIYTLITYFINPTSTLQKTLLYIGIKLLSRILTIIVSMQWIGKKIVSQILPEEV